MQDAQPYQPKNKIRIVTAASLFDGHDAAINVMRRIIQSTGAEVIHLGHDRSAQELVDCAIQEDANAIALTSYQGGHNEYFKYMFDLLKERGCAHIKLFGGGGGVILPEEIEALHQYGITRIYSPDDGRALGLQGMINDLIQKSDYATGFNLNGEVKSIATKNHYAIARLISCAENNPEEFQKYYPEILTANKQSKSPVLGITGTGGAGKSSLVDELVRRFLIEFKTKTVAIISVDPSKRKTGGALLGDRIRMNAINNPRVYMRSLATRQSNLALSKHVKEALEIVKAAHYDLIILETSGIGQSDTEITEFADTSLYVMTPEYGAATQLEKIDMLDFADTIALNKFDKRGALDALRDVKKQYKRNHKLFDVDDSVLPVFGTIASQFNDPGMNNLYRKIMNTISDKTGADLKSSYHATDEMSEKVYIIPPTRTRYLSEITENNRNYAQWAKDQSTIAGNIYALKQSVEVIDNNSNIENKLVALDSLHAASANLKLQLDGQCKKLIDEWPAKYQNYKNDFYEFQVRSNTLRIQTTTTSLSHQRIPKVSLPKYESWKELLYWLLMENVPGEFPFAAGVFRFKREGEDPTRMFAGEGGPERTNKRFHYVSMGMPAKRLSTAFDSVTLYGRDPDYSSGYLRKNWQLSVSSSVCCLDDAKKLYSGFNLSRSCNVGIHDHQWSSGNTSRIFYECSHRSTMRNCTSKKNGLEAEVEQENSRSFIRKER
jgi:methylmalonyl-CoA mutase